MNTSPLVQELTKLQKVFHLSDAAFAEKLGIPRSQWTLIRGGNMRPGMSLLSGVAKAFPGLKDLVLVEVASYKRRVEPQSSDTQAVA